MKTVTFLNQKYQLLENYKDGYESEAVEYLFTEYFLDYDYIIGDWSYGKLRLKGFCDKQNSKYNEKNWDNSIWSWDEIKHSIKKQVFTIPFWIVFLLLNKDYYCEFYD